MRAAQTKGFSGGVEIAHALKRMDFCLFERLPPLRSVSLIVYTGKWNTNQLAKHVLFDYSNSRFAQFGFCLICIPAKRLFECK